MGSPFERTLRTNPSTPRTKVHNQRYGPSSRAPAADADDADSSPIAESNSAVKGKTPRNGGTYTSSFKEMVRFPMITLSCWHASDATHPLICGVPNCCCSHSGTCCCMSRHSSCSMVLVLGAEAHHVLRVVLRHRRVLQCPGRTAPLMTLIRSALQSQMMCQS